MLSGKLGSQNVGVEQKADHRLQFRPIPVGERDSQQDVFLPRIAVEQSVQRSGKDGEQSSSFPVGCSRATLRARVGSSRKRCLAPR